MDLERISKAFYLGYLWSLGRRFAMDRAMAMDAKRDLRDVRWVTINGTHVPISKKTGKIVGHLKHVIEWHKTQQDLTEKRPKFSDFVASTRGLTTKSKAYQVKKYMRDVYVDTHTTAKLKNAPKGCDTVHFIGRSAGETASHINKDKLELLPYLPEIFAKATHKKEKETKHPDIEFVLYSKCKFVVEGKQYFVELVSKKPKDDNRVFFQYMIDKADYISNKKWKP